MSTNCGIEIYKQSPDLERKMHAHLSSEMNCSIVVIVVIIVIIIWQLKLLDAQIT